MKSKLAKLDAIRGFAAIYVVFHHSFFSESFQIGHYNLSFLFKFGQEAVILFFLMSGFVIEYSVELSWNKAFVPYFQKRLYRIYIPLTIVIVTQYLLMSVQAGAFINPRPLELVENLVMLQDIGALKPNVICSPYLDNLPLWSLSYEWWFYMSFYLLFRTFSKFRSNEVFVTVLVITSSITYIFYPFFVNRIFLYYGIWWAGSVMAKSFIVHSYVRFKDLRLSLFTLVAATLILAVNAYVHKQRIISTGISPLLEIRHFVFTLATIAIALLWQKVDWKLFDSVMGRFAVLAPCSYVLYISHYFLVAKATYLQTFTDNKYFAFVLYLVIALMFSYIVEVIIYPVLRNMLMKKNKKSVAKMVM